MRLASPRLKRPWLLQIMAVLLMLAPVGNVFISFYGTGETVWTDPEVFLSWVSKIQLLDKLWLALTFLAGVSLFLQKKMAWLLAILTLALIPVINIYRWVTTGELIEVDFGYFHWQIWLSTAATLLALAVVLFARYPYIDRRSTWWGAALSRLDIHTAVTLIAGDIFAGHTVNISSSGALVQLDNVNEKISDVRFVDLVIKELNINIPCEVVQVTGPQVRLRFRTFARADQRILHKWLSSRA